MGHLLAESSRAGERKAGLPGFINTKAQNDGKGLPDNLNQFQRLSGQPVGLDFFARIFVQQTGLTNSFNRCHVVLFRL